METKNIILGVLLLLITVATVVLQLAEYKLQEYDTIFRNKYLDMIEKNNSEIFFQNELLLIDYAKTNYVLGADTICIDNTCHPSTDFSWDDLINISNPYHEKIQSLTDSRNQIYNEIKSLQEQKPIGWMITRIISIVLIMSFSALSMILYLSLYLTTKKILLKHSQPSHQADK